MRARTAAVLFFFMVTTAVGAQELAEQLARARKAIDAGDSAKALALLAEAGTVVATPREKARTFFYMARAHEIAGRMAEAKAAYANAVEADGQYGAALNNLAQLEAADGDTQSAVAHLKRAVALGDERRLLYAFNLAALEADAGNRAEALSLYAEILKTRPEDVDVRARFIRVSEPAAAVKELRAMLLDGAMHDAERVALELASDARFKEVARSLLAIAVESLALRRVPLDEFDASPSAVQLAQLRKDPALREGVREIRLVYDRAPAGGKHYAWWSKTEESVAAMARLLREAGQQSARDGNDTAAETALMAALELQKGTDPDAFLALTDLYFTKGRIADLRELEAKHGALMLDAKQVSSALRDWGKAYDYHVALGTIYHHLERDGSMETKDRASAIYQLEDALRDARMIGIAMDAKAVDLLAASYVRTQQPARAAEIRITAAEQFKEKGKLYTAAKTIEPVKDQVTALDAVTLGRYQKLTRALPMGSSNVPNVKPLGGGGVLRHSVIDDLEKELIQIQPRPARAFEPPPLVESEQVKLIKDALPKLGTLDEPLTRRSAIEELRNLGVEKIETSVESRTADVVFKTSEGQRMSVALSVDIAAKRERLMLAHRDGAPPRTSQPVKIPDDLRKQISTLLKKLSEPAAPAERERTFESLATLGVEKVETYGSDLTAHVTLKTSANQTILVPFDMSRIRGDRIVRPPR